MSDNISYTPEEVASILKISKYTVYELIKRGELPAYRIGRKVRVEETDLEIYKQNAKGHVPGFFKPARQIIDRTLSSNNSLIICGQDVVLDILTRYLEKSHPQMRFLRQYVGSMDGLMALYRGAAHAVTTHLWDRDNDEYNVPYVRRLLPGHRAVIINLLYRMEGFYVAKGNPKDIHTWVDLLKPKIKFINREHGSGARVLLDEQLRKHDMDHLKIIGYDREEMSHLAIASAIARTEADVGLGIEKVATQVQGIEFIPLHKERYDLVIRKEDIEKPHFQSLLTILRSTAFRNEVIGLGGYDISRMGEIIAEI